MDSKLQKHSKAIEANHRQDKHLYDNWPEYDILTERDSVSKQVTENAKKN